MSEAAMQPAVEQEARTLGWVPQEDFRGDKSRWVDAETFVQRGHEIMPILKQNNARLTQTVAELQETVNSLVGELKTSKGTLEELKTFSAETIKQRVADAKRDVLVRLKQAREDGNVVEEAELFEQLTDLKDAQKAASAPPPPAKKEEPATPSIDPALTSWMAEPENAWFNKDRRKTSLAMGIAQELREDPATKHLVGRAFYDRISQEVEAVMGEKREPGASKVEGSRGGSGGGNGSGGRGKTYADLPADAKKACDDQGRKFIGTPAFKDAAAWREYYVRMVTEE